jgi:hypothetical protein
MKIKRVTFQDIACDVGKPLKPTQSIQLCVYCDGKTTNHGHVLNLNQVQLRLANAPTNQLINSRHDCLNVFHAKQSDFMHCCDTDQFKHCVFSTIAWIIYLFHLLCGKFLHIVSKLLVYLVFIQSLVNTNIPIVSSVVNK